MVEPQPSKLMMRVRFSLPAPDFEQTADMAQSVEHSLGKGEVSSSILVIGTIYFGDAVIQTTVR